MSNDRPSRAPCGCPWRDSVIRRTYRGPIGPTMFIDCRCGRCKQAWTEHYEFDFSVPLDGRTWERQGAT